MRDPQYNDFTSLELRHDYDEERLFMRVFLNKERWVDLSAVPFRLHATPDEVATALEQIAKELRTRADRIRD